MLHCCPVFTLEGESGALLHWKRVPKKIQEALGALPDEEGSWSIEDRIGIFFPDHQIDQGMDLIESSHGNVVWCEDCLEGAPCSCWDGIDFDEIGFMPRSAESGESPKKKQSAPFDVKRWIEDRKAEWEYYKTQGKALYETVKDLYGSYAEFRREFEQQIGANAGMNAAQAAVILGVTLPCTSDGLKRAYGKAVLKAHPDAGGSAEELSKVMKAHAVLQGTVT